MTNYRNSDVIRLIGINNPEQIKSDEDFQIGTITLEVGPKVRIVWKGQTTPEFANKTNLHKWDNRTFWIESDNAGIMDVLPKLDESDIVPITDILDKVSVQYMSDNPDYPEYKADTLDVQPKEGEVVAMMTIPDMQLKPVKPTRTRASKAVPPKTA